MIFFSKVVEGFTKHNHGLYLYFGIENVQYILPGREYEKETKIKTANCIYNSIFI